MDRRRGEDGPDHPEAERERAPLHELARDARLLRGGRGVDLAEDLDELALRAIRSVDEAEHADDEREQRNEPEEDLVGERAGEERAFVGDKPSDDPAAARERAG